MKKILYTSIFLMGGLALTSCSKDFTETKFYQSKNAEPLTSVEELTSFVNGAYAGMRNMNYLGAYYLAYGEVRSDEMYNNLAVGRFRGESTYTMDANNGDARGTWDAIYRVVANANIVINSANNLTWLQSNDATKIANEVKSLKAQAYAIRGLAFFDLLRLYGQKYAGGDLGVPLPLEYNPTASSSRATIAQTEAQIEADWEKALNLFQEVADSQGTTLVDLVDATNKTQLSPLSVKAYQSRFYLYKGNWERVISLSQEIITSGKYSVVPAADLETSFTKPSATNSVFELAVGVNGSLGAESYEYLFNSSGYGTILLTDYAYGLYEDGKFSDLQSKSNVKLVRYEEVLLNATEAYLKKGNATSALTYYNQLRTQRGLTAAATVTLDELKKERLRELLGEGLRYWDLLRWGDPVPYYSRTGATNPANNRTVPNNLFVFPIPQLERNSEYSNVTQNAGY